MGRATCYVTAWITSTIKNTNGVKYLREAEAHQKQLSDTEKLTLKQAIERAQRGLREAVDSQVPYALSRRSHHTGGFAPAKPDTQIASILTSAQPRFSQSSPRTPSREGDDLGQPIRLAGAEIVTQTPLAALTNPGPSPSAGPAPDTMPQPLPIGSVQPAQLPDIAKLSQSHEQTVLDDTGIKASSTVSSTLVQPEAATTSPGKPTPSLADASPSEEAARIAEPPVLVTTGPPAMAPASKPKLDAPAAAQTDLLSPLPPLTPTTDAQPEPARQPPAQAQVPVQALPAAKNSHLRPRLDQHLVCRSPLRTQELLSLWQILAFPRPRL